jgi:hypothetical protein
MQSMQRTTTGSVWDEMYMAPPCIVAPMLSVKRSVRVLLLNVTADRRQAESLIDAAPAYMYM